MLRKKTTKTKTVSDKISELLARNANGEADSSDEQNEDPRVEEEFDEYDLPDARTSDIRKRNVKLLSEQSARYRGKISSRNELEEEEVADSTEGEESEEEEEEDDDDDDYSSDDNNDDALAAFSKKLNGAKGKKEMQTAEDDSEDDMDHSANADEDSDDDDVDDDDDDVDEEADGEEEDYEYSDDEAAIEGNDDASDEENGDGADIIAETNRQAEVQKGQSVQNQLHIWERLLEMRIHTQKILSKSNQLPPPVTLKAQQDNEKLNNITQQSINSVSKLLSTLLQLQNAFDQQFSEQRTALKKSLKRALPKQVTEGDSAVPIKRFAEHIDVHFQEFKPYRNTVLLKWDDRTKLLTPGAGAKKKSLTEDYDVIRKIENTLQNRNTLIEKSQTTKDGDEVVTVNEVVANGDAQNAHKHKRNVELYDDSDFYHQQLRELIEYKSNTSVSASEVTQQYMELQKLRQKMKKKVDTRASKGRKLRYTVHNKLINFMAPDDTSTWTEESKDELYRSLFAA